ncbi:MAG: vitamin K epoxide reductase family protein [Nitrolancea sp.]
MVAARALNWRLITAVLALCGIADAVYLTIIHYDTGALICTVGNCHTVQTSKYSTIGPIPVAVLGLAMYVTVGAISIVRWRRPDLSSTLTMTSFAMVLAGTIYAAYLTYLELNVINAICQWCVISAILTVGLLLSEGFGFFTQLE